MAQKPSTLLAISMLTFVVLMDQSEHPKAALEDEINYFQNLESHLENEIKPPIRKDHHQPHKGWKSNIYEEDKPQKEKAGTSDNPCMDNPLAVGCTIYEALKDLVGVDDSKFSEYIARILAKEILILPLAKGALIVSIADRNDMSSFGDLEYNVEQFNFNTEMNSFKDLGSHVDNEMKDHQPPHTESNEVCKQDKQSPEETKVETYMDDPCLWNPLGMGCPWKEHLKFLGTEAAREAITKQYFDSFFGPNQTKTCLQRIVCEVALIFRTMPNAMETLQYWIEEKVSEDYLPVLIILKEAAKNPGSCESMPCDALFRSN